MVVVGVVVAVGVAVGVDMISWSVGELSCKADDGILTVELNKARFGAELRPDTMEVLKEFSHFLLASKATDQELIKLVEVFSETEKR